jgi:hypothetical protein
MAQGTGRMAQGKYNRRDGLFPSALQKPLTEHSEKRLFYLNF